MARKGGGTATLVATRSGPKPTIYSDLTLNSAARIAEGQRFQAQLMGADTAALIASNRPDLAGTPQSLLQSPITYQERVLRMWEFYNTDPFFHRLVERVCDFVANGSVWEVPINPEGSWIQKLENWGVGREARVEREEDIWNVWANSLNEDVPNILPGLDQVVRWATKHFLLSGMFVPHWEYDTFRFGKQSFILPARMTCYPAAVITLRRENQSFLQEDVYVLQSQNRILQEGFVIQAPQQVYGKLMNQIKLPTLNVRSTYAKPGTDEAVAIKYAWTPGDLGTVRFGQRAVTGIGVYPTPPFYGLMPQFVVRQKLFASDAAILDGVLNYLMVWSLGDEKNQPGPPVVDENGVVDDPGMLAAFAQAIRGQPRVGPATELFVPYWAKLNIMMPDAKLLLSEEKYWASTIEIMQAFGMFFSRSISSRGAQLERINISAFEEFMGGIRMHIAAFLRMLAKRIVNANQGRLGAVPNWVPQPLNTKSDQFLSSLKNLVQYGKVSSETLLRYYGLDSGVEVRRIAHELAQDQDDLFEANAPVAYKQQAVEPGAGDIAGANREKPGEPGGEPPAPKDKTKTPVTTPKRRPGTKTTGISRTKQTGRPPTK